VLGLDGGVGVGVGLALVGDGDGDGDALADVGDGAGEVTGGGLAGEHAAGEGNSALPLGVPPGLAGVALPWVDDGPPETAGPPLPLVLPGPPSWVEPLVPDGLSFTKEASVPCSPVRAKTPATTRTTAPATARAGRSQAIAGPTGIYRGAPALRGGLAQPRAMAPWRAGRTDRSRPPLPAAAASPPSPAAEPGRMVLNQDWHRTANTQPRIMNSPRSSHHCRLSHGSASRAWIFAKPSPTGSI